MLDQRQCCLLWGLTAGLLAVASPSRVAAEEPNPAVTACDDKAQGAACTVQRSIKNNEGEHDTRGTAGTCQTDECCTLDYSKGSPPETVCGPCLACKAGVPAPTPDAPDVNASAGSAEPPRSETVPPPNAPNEKRGCSVGGSSPAGWWSLLCVAAVGVVRRRRQH